MDVPGGDVLIPLDESTKGADSPWLVVPIILLFLAFVAVLYFT